MSRAFGDFARGRGVYGFGNAALDRCRSTEKFERCVKKVKKSSPRVNPWAICTCSIKACRKHARCP